MNTRFSLSAATLMAAAIALAGCQSSDPGGAEASSAESAEEPVAEPTATVVLRVVDTSKTPVPGALVALGEFSGKTAADGSVQLTAVTADERVATVRRSGFAPSSVVVRTVIGETIQRTVVLHPLGERVGVDTSVESTVSRGGVRVRVPPHAVVDATGAPVTSNVEMTIAPLNPRGDGVLDSPGPLVGRTAEGSESTNLESFFMADITIWSGDEPLEVASGQQLEIQFPLPTAEERGLAIGDSIPAWWYDVDAGVWQQEGTGVVGLDEEGNWIWTASVSHLSWWNCDEGWQGSSCVVADVIDGQTGEPIESATFEFFSDAISYGATGTTGTDGRGCLDFDLGGAIHGTVEAAGYAARSFEYNAQPTDAGLCGSEGQCGRFEVTLEKAAGLSGAVLLHNGLPLGGASVRADYTLPDGGVGSTFGVTDSDGIYCVGAPRGSQVQVSAFVGVFGQLAAQTPPIDMPANAPLVCEKGGTEAPPLTVAPGVGVVRRGEACTAPGAPADCLCQVAGEAGNTMVCPIGLARESGAKWASALGAVAQFDTEVIYNPGYVFRAQCPTEAGLPFDPDWDPGSCSFAQAPPETTPLGNQIVVKDTDFGTFRFDFAPQFTGGTFDSLGGGSAVALSNVEMKDGALTSDPTQAVIPVHLLRDVPSDAPQFITLSNVTLTTGTDTPAPWRVESGLFLYKTQGQ